MYLPPGAAAIQNGAAPLPACLLAYLHYLYLHYLYLPTSLPTCTCTVPLLYITLMYLVLSASVYMYLALERLWRANSPVLSLILSGPPLSHTRIAWTAPCLILYHKACTGHVPFPLQVTLAHTAFLACLYLYLPTALKTQTFLPTHLPIHCC